MPPTDRARRERMAELRADIRALKYDIRLEMSGGIRCQDRLARHVEELAECELELEELGADDGTTRSV